MTITHQQVIRLIESTFDWDQERIKRWYENDNELLLGLSPKYLVATGRGDKVVTLISKHRELYETAKS